MKKVLAILSATVLLASISTVFAQAQKLADGTYVAKFGFECGVLTIRGGRPIKYTYGPCGKKPTNTWPVSKNGNTINIGGASFEITSANNKKIGGIWKLYGAETDKTFSK